MTKPNLLGPWVRRFLLEYLSPNATWLETRSAAIETRFVCCSLSWLNKCKKRSTESR